MNSGEYFQYANVDEGLYGDESIWHGNCQLGQLTEVGGEMCTRMGAGLRSVYVDKYQFLPETLTNENLKDTLYIRSTDVARARESLTSIMEGLYPGDTRRGVYIP